jgi:hypothetical protein
MRGLAANTALLVSSNNINNVLPVLYITFRRRHPLFIGAAQDQRNCTVIAGVFSAEAPQHGTAVSIEIYRSIALGIVTTTTSTIRLTATVVIRHQVISTIYRVTTGSDPGYRRRFGAGRTGSIGSTTTGAQSAAHGTVAPIITALRIANFLD